jgi:hypothetical protein
MTATKINPEQSKVSGLPQLLPQLVGSCDLGGGVSGDGNAARIGPIKSKSYRRGRLKTPSPIIDFSHGHRPHIYVQGRSNEIATAPSFVLRA